MSLKKYVPEGPEVSPLKEVRELRKWNGTSLDYIGEAYMKSPNLNDVTETAIDSVEELLAITKPTRSCANIVNWSAEKVGQAATFTSGAKGIAIPCQKGASYTLKYFGSITINRRYWSEVDADGNILKARISYTNEETITTTEDACAFLCIEWTTDTTDVSKMVVVKGTKVPQEYHPYGIEHVFSAGYDKSVSGTTSLSCPGARNTWMTFGVQGNTSQASTPTPSTPVDVKGVGDKTANIFDMHYDVGYSGSYPNITTVSGGKSTEWLKTEDFNSHFYWVWNVSIKTASCVMGIVYSNDKSELLYRDGLFNASSLSGEAFTDIAGGGGNPFSINKNYTYMKFYIIGWAYTNRLGIYKTSQSTFIPYGVQIPVTSGVNCGVVDLGTLSWTAPITTNLYLEEPLHKLATYADNLNGKTLTRNVCVKVLDGTENWTYSGIANQFYLEGQPLSAQPNTPLCTHYEGIIPTTSDMNMPDKSVRAGFLGYEAYLYIKDSSFNNNATSLKAWLAEQYAAGTPVTFYYPLAQPTSETVDIEKPKTLKGDNTITIGTEIQPTGLSGVYKSYTK